MYRIVQWHPIGTTTQGTIYMAATGEYLPAYVLKDRENTHAPVLGPFSKPTCLYILNAVRKETDDGSPATDK
jgi:hypothetical protein